MSKLLDDRNELQVNSIFLARSLPILNHLQISDALQNVIGQEYQERINLFERSKNKELYEYAQNCQAKCVRLLNQRLFTYLKFMSDEDQGCLPFKYGYDINPNLTELQIQIVEDKNQALYRQKFKDMIDQKKIIQELFDICARPGKRNDILIEHKLKRGQNTSTLHVVKKMILEFRTLNLKNYDDLDVYLQIKDLQFNPNQSVQQSDNKPAKVEEKQQNQQNNTIMAPKPAAVANPTSMKYFFIQGEQLRPYQRFEKKFLSLFHEAYKDYKEFKTQQFVNLSEQTKFSIQIVKDIDNIKQNIAILQNDVDTNNSDSFNRNIELKAEVQQNLDQLQKKINHIEYSCKENSYNISRQGKIVETTIESIEENASILERKIDFIDQQVSELIEENFQQKLNDFNTNNTLRMDYLKEDLMFQFQQMLDEKLSKIKISSSQGEINEKQEKTIDIKRPSNLSVKKEQIKPKEEVKKIEPEKKKDSIINEKNRLTGNQSPLSLKQQKKQELQKMLEDKKKRAELAGIKKKE